LGEKVLGSPAVEQLAQVMAAVKSVDDAVHAFNDAGNEKEKTDELGKRLDKLRAQVDQLLSQPGPKGNDFHCPDARQQSRSFAPLHQWLRRSPNSNRLCRDRQR